MKILFAQQIYKKLQLFKKSVIDEISRKLNIYLIADDLFLGC